MADFPAEFRKRLEHVEGLPGKAYHNMGLALHRTAELFNTNTVVLASHLMKFVDHPVLVDELPKGFDTEASRLLFNYLAALAALRDAQRVAHRTLWPVDDDEERACDKCGRRDPKRSKWEVEVWDPKRKELLGDNRIAFLTKLRDYSVHYATPVLTVATRVESTSDTDQPPTVTNAVGVSRDELLRWDGWGAQARSFITDHDGDTIELRPLVTFFARRVHEFYGWFTQEINKKVGLETLEYVDKFNDLTNWYKVYEASSQYKVLRNLHQLKKRVESRLDRAANKTGGWRVITCGGNGVCVVGESEWPPLPPDPRD